MDYVEVKGEVVFNGVDFGYNDEKIVLHGIKLYAKPGQKIAFVGSTGAGKTTITNLINRFYDIQDGKIRFDGINFNKEDIKKNLTLFLYPDDSDEAGRILRIYQQYFMVSSAAQLILDECVAKGCNLHDLSDYVVIQINDTHPTMVIPELISLLVERGLEMDEAIEVVTKSCAYTNHTILAEA